MGEEVQVPGVKPGAETSEYKELQSSKLWSTIGTLLGVVISVGSMYQPAGDTKAGIVVGALLAVVSIGYRTLVQLGYIKSRTDIKVG